MGIRDLHGNKVFVGFFSETLPLEGERTKRDFFNEPCEHGEVKNPTSPLLHLKIPERFCGAFLKSDPPEARVPRALAR